MTSTARQTIPPAPRGALRLLWSIAALWLPAAALAQGSACDQLKATLAARIEATGVRGYSLEAVPAATKVPAGAKAIGNCEGGAFKILYRRWGGAAAPASAAAVVAPEVPAKRPPPVVRAEVPAPMASVPAPTPAPPPALAPASVVQAEAVEPPPARASEVRVTGVVESVVSPALPPEPVEEKPPLSQRVSGFVATYWRWLLALLLVPLAVLGWFWRAHYLAYDKNGLPRGPRL
jgi:hypothetical protein